LKVKGDLIDAVKSLKTAYIDKSHCLRLEKINHNLKEIHGFVEYGDYGYIMDVIDIYKKKI